VSTGGVVTLPSAPGLYRVKAQVYAGISPSANFRIRLSVGWINGSGLYRVDMGRWAGAFDTGGPSYATAEVESLFVGNSSPRGTCTQVEVLLASDHATTTLYSIDPFSSVTPSSNPPYYVTFMSVEWLGSDGTF